jgi:transcriptional regulator with XRE-family HTH domain
MASSLQRRFGTVLRDFRARAGLSQEQLADLAGLHRTYVSQLERGLKAPSLVSLQRLAKALRTRPYLLVKAAEEAP